MATWTPPTTLATGQILSSPAWNAVANDVLFLYQRPYAMIYDSVGTSIPSSALTQVNLTGVTGIGYNMGLADNNIFVPYTGIYSVQFSIQLSSGAGGLSTDFLQAQAFHNGADVLAGSLVGSYTVEPASTGGGLVMCNAGDTLALVCLQTSVSTLSTAASANSTFLHVAFVGSQ